MHAIGIDIGGTKIAGAVVDEFGAIVREDRQPTTAGQPEEIENTVVEMIERLSDGPEEIVAAGVAAAGFIDASQSIVYYAPNINWRHEPFREKLESRLDLPIIIENDANAAGWAEFRYGAGRLVSDMVILTIGTGVGGAIVSNDRLFRGGFGAGAEVGHMRVVPGGLPCGCGAHGCIEQYGSGRALERFAGELADAGGIGQALADVRSRKGALKGKDISKLILAGDPGAIAALRQFSATGSARPAPASARCSTRRCSCSAAVWRRPVTCCSSRSVSRTSRTFRPVGITRSPSSASPSW